MTGPVDQFSVVIAPDVSRFAAQAKAGIEAALKGLAAQIAGVFDRVEAEAGAAGREIGQEFQQGSLRASAALVGVGATAQREFAQVGAAAAAASAATSNRLGTALDFVKSKLLILTAGITAGLAGITAFGLKSAAALEQTEIGLKALTGSAETAKAFLTELQTFAATTPFEFAGVADASRRILAFGTSVGIARAQVIPTLTTIGDLVSVLGGSQEQVDSVVRALGQMASKGKLSQEEILQLAEALPGFNANAAIASQLGLSVADTLAKITAGEIDAKTGINALLAGMQKFPGAAGAMAQQSQTLLGVFSTFKDTIGQALTNAFQPVIPEIKGALSELTPILGGAIGQLAPVLGKVLSAILPLVGRLVEAIVPILTPLLDALGPALDQLGPSLLPLGQAIGEIAIALAPLIPLLAEFLIALIQIAVPVLLVVAKTLQLLTPLINFMSRAIHELNKALAMIDWAAVGQAIVDFFVMIGHWFADFFTKAKAAFSEFPDNVKKIFVLFTATIFEHINLAIEFVKSIPGRIMDALAGLGGLLVQAGKDLVLGLWNGISSLGGWLWSKVKSFVIDNTVGAVKNALGIHSPSQVFADQVGAQIPAGIMEGIRGGMPDLAGLISGVTPGAGTQTANAGAGAAGALGNIIVNVTFAGALPTPEQARRTGQEAGAGVANALARRNIGTAVRRL